MNTELDKEVANYINSYQEYCSNNNIELRKELITFVTNQKNSGYLKLFIYCHNKDCI